MKKMKEMKIYSDHPYYSKKVLRVIKDSQDQYQPQRQL